MVAQKPEVVVITGASAGVGRATALEFARRGACLGLVARGERRLEAARRDVESAGGRAVILAADVADPETAERIATMTTEAFGDIDVWINNAMASVYSRIIDMPAAEFKRVTEVTYLGYVYGTQAALRRMMPRNRGAIVQVGSALAYRSIPMQSAYCAAKHAIRGFTDSLRSELIADKSRIRLTMVQLPAMNTPQFVWVKSRLDEKAKPPSPIFQPEVAARTIFWAAHQDRREVNVGGITSAVIAANKVAPGFLDHYLVGRSFGHTGQPRDPDQPDNLWHPAPGQWAAHGPFDADATDHSLQVQLTRRRAGLLATGAAVLGVAGALWFARRRTYLSRGTSI
jgi:short-subunit dehydrogenase